MTNRFSLQSAAQSLIVVGASAGGVGVIRSLLASLPENLPAAVGVVIHRPLVEEDDRLAKVFAIKSKLPVTTAVDGEIILSGHVYVCRAGLHLTIEENMWRYISGPRENGVRPSIDYLFRGAAAAFGRRAIGIILSGVLDDGVNGLEAIKRANGSAVIQSPEEALFDGMPSAAIQSVEADAIVPVAEMAAVLEDILERLSTNSHTSTTAAIEEASRPSFFSCPDCGGVLSQNDKTKNAHFVCRIGHAYSANTLLAMQNDSFEAAISTAYRTLVEKQDLSERLAERARKQGADSTAKRYDREARTAKQHAHTVSQLFKKTSPGPFEEESDLYA